MAGPRSLYDVLNVAPEAEPVVVEAAYKALIKKYHPDQAAEAPVSKDAAAINEAFAVLKDPARRADYDHRLWSKQQAIRLAGLQATAPRSRVAAISGWIVAGLLACTLAAVAVGKSLAPPPLTAVAQAAETHDSEQPARAAAAKAAAAEAVHDGVAIPSSAAVIARVRAERKLRSQIRAAPAAQATVRHRKARAAPPPAAPPPRQEKDFLERQGYIY